MLRQRVIVALLLLPLGVGAVVLGEWAFTGLVTLILLIAAWEAIRLYRATGFRPASALILTSVAGLVVTRYLAGFDYTDELITILVLASLTWHLWEYERGHDRAAADFGVSLSVSLYLGWIGAYFISLRQLPDGGWWLTLTMLTVWCADSGAYFIGSRWGRIKLSPRLSPKKTWEGYLSGVAAAVLGGMAFGALWGQFNPQAAAFNLWSGALIGLAMGVLPTLGDLGESMIKRQAGVKDSGSALPGHGGVFDRIDSWLWAAAIGYYLINGLLLNS